MQKQESNAAIADVDTSTGYPGRNHTSGRSYGDLEVSETKQLKALRDENTKLKELLVEAMLDKAIREDVASQNSHARRRASGLARLRHSFEASERPACNAQVGLFAEFDRGLGACFASVTFSTLRAEP